MFSSANCSLPAPASSPSNAGIAGEGILLSFIITAGIVLCLSASLVLQEVGVSPKKGGPPVIRRKLLSSYSDQQILNGIGIQCVGLATADTLVPYHFFIVWMLSLCSIAVHNASMLVLARDFRGDWVLLWLRQGLMAVNLILSCIYGVFVLVSKIRNTPDTLPVACAFELLNIDGSAPDVASAYVATMVTIAANVLIFALATWYLHSALPKGRAFRIVQIVGLVLMAASATGAAVRAMLLSQAFGRPNVNLSDDGERQWNFGQLLAVTMLVYPLISTLEIWRGELAVHHPQAPAEDAGEKEPEAADEAAPETDKKSIQLHDDLGSQQELIKS